MWPYFIMVGVPAAFAFYSYTRRDKFAEKAVIPSFFLILIALLCLRAYSVGIDVQGYQSNYDLVNKYSLGYILTHAFSMEYEAGYLILTKFLLMLHADFRVLLIAVSLISLIPIWVLYQEEVRNDGFLAIVIFLNIGLFSIYFSALRQVIAVGFGVIAYKFTKEKKLLLFLLMVLVATLFHKSAFILVLMYPLYHAKLKWISSLITASVSVLIVYIFRVPTFRFLGNIFSSIYDVEIAITNAITILLLMIIFVIFCYMLPDNSLMDNDTIGLRNILGLSVVLQIFASVNPLAMRMNYYYLIFIPIVITRAIGYASKKNKKIAEVALLVMILFFTTYYFYFAFLGSDTLHIYPYYFFWENY